jgi:hypothetical protein
MKKLFLLLLFVFAFGNIYYYKTAGEIKGNRLFDGSYTINIVCIDGIKYIIIDGFKRAGITVKYKIKNGKAEIDKCYQQNLSTSNKGKSN